MEFASTVSFFFHLYFPGLGLTAAETTKTWLKGKKIKNKKSFSWNFDEYPQMNIRYLAIACSKPEIKKCPNDFKRPENTALWGCFFQLICRPIGPENWLENILSNYHFSFLLLTAGEFLKQKSWLFFSWVTETFTSFNRFVTKLVKEKY